MLVSLFLTLPSLVAAVPASTFPYVRGPLTAAFAPIHTASNPIPDNYIVVLKPETSLDALLAHTSLIHSTALRVNAALTNTTTVGVKRVYTETLMGYSGHFDEHTLSLIRANPEVDYVEHDSVVWASEIQNGAPWGLARISHRERLRLSTFQKYEFDTNGGDGVDVYVIDTGKSVVFCCENLATCGNIDPNRYKHRTRFIRGSCELGPNHS
jgi:cerevisin